MVFDAPHAVHVEDRDVPVPGSGEVQIRVAFAGICGSDLHGYTGKSGRRVSGMVMGHEASGFVSETGRGVSTALVGRQVTFNPILYCEGLCGHVTENRCEQLRVIGVDPSIQGAFADYLVVPLHRLVLLDGIDLRLGACVEPLAVAVQAIERARVEAGQRVMIVGGGMIGQCLALVARARGAASVTLSDPNPHRRAAAEAMGYETVPPDELESRPLSDVSFDAVGIDATAAASINAVRKGGTVCFVGLGLPTVSIPLFGVVVAERSLVGSFAYTDAVFEESRDMLASRSVDLTSAIGADTNFEGIGEAFEDLASARRHDLKILMSTGAY
jgi:2-desacetyl-2-hydroxyethyl bacteriochlorophyllide A dehydrogenase